MSLGDGRVVSESDSRGIHVIGFLRETWLM